MSESACGPKPEECSKFYTCSAPICPLDPKWPRAVHLGGERVCFYLLASGKEGAEERFRDDPIFAACRIALPLVVARHPVIGRVVERAAKSPFRKCNLPGRASKSGAGEG